MGHSRPVQGIYPLKNGAGFVSHDVDGKTIAWLPSKEGPPTGHKLDVVTIGYNDPISLSPDGSHIIVVDEGGDLHRFAVADINKVEKYQYKHNESKLHIIAAQELSDGTIVGSTKLGGLFSLLHNDVVKAIVPENTGPLRTITHMRYWGTHDILMMHSLVEPEDASLPYTMHIRKSDDLFATTPLQSELASYYKYGDVICELAKGNKMLLANRHRAYSNMAMFDFTEKKEFKHLSSAGPTTPSTAISPVLGPTAVDDHAVAGIGQSYLALIDASSNTLSPDYSRVCC